MKKKLKGVDPTKVTIIRLPEPEWVRCGDCIHFTPGGLEGKSVGTCALDNPSQEQSFAERCYDTKHKLHWWRHRSKPPLFPHTPRVCSGFTTISPVKD